MEGESLSEKGEKKFLLEEITNDENRTMYRNPPAHTRYMTYEKASECRQKVRDTLLEIRRYLA